MYQKSRKTDGKHHDKFKQFAKLSGEVFATERAAQILALDNNSASHVLARWHKQGLIARLQRGLYSVIPVDTPSPDFALEDAWSLVPHIFSPAYIGGWSAAEHWDLTEQIFNTLMVFTTRPVPHKKITVEKQAFYLKHIQDSHLFGLQPIWRKQEKILISDIHRTIIDCFNDSDTAGGIQHAIDCLKNYLKKTEADLNILAHYANLLNNGALYKRLGFILESLVNKNHPTLLFFKAKLTQGYAYLDPKQKQNVKLITTWRIFIPKTFEIEQ